MDVNVPLGPVDIIILLIIGILMLGGIKMVRGFFHEGSHHFKDSTYNGKGALKMKVAIQGMQCGHCEANINDTIRANFDVKKVTSNHTKGEAVILADHDIDSAKLKQAIAESGYQVIAIEKSNR